MRVLLAITLIVAGCSASGPDAAFDDYIERLQRTLGVDAPPAGVEALPTAPRPGQLRIELAGSSVDALDFLALRGCALQVTVGKRNSSLGRMAADSQRLLLELEFLRHAPACEASLRQQGEDQLARTIAEAAAQKQRQLPALLFNATLGAAEYRSLWRAPTQLGQYPDNTGAAVVTALASVNTLARRWLEGDYRADNEAFELLLGDIASADGGAMARALALQSARLGQADELLQRRAERGPLCTATRRDPASEVLDNVVARSFVGAIQPWSVAVDRRRQALLPPLETLEGLLQAVLPPDYEQWRTRRDELLQYWSGAPKRHVARIQALQAPCRGGV